MSKNLQSTVLSFALMLVVWGVLFGSWQFALAFLVLMGIHEMGHWLVARMLGIEVSMPFFTPLGALIRMREMPKNAFDEALMALGGPVLGSVGALVTLLIGHIAESHVLIAAANVAFWLNLFNLIPLSPLDGGRISMAIDRRLWVLGVPLLAGAFYITGLDIFSLIMAVLIGQWAWQDIQHRAEQAVETPEYFAIGAGRRIGIAAAYISLTAGLLYMLLA